MLILSLKQVQGSVDAGTLLHPVDIDVASEGVKGRLGVHFYFLAERKTFLLS